MGQKTQKPPAFSAGYQKDLRKNLCHKFSGGSQLWYRDAWLGLEKGSNTVHYRALRPCRNRQISPSKTPRNRRFWFVPLSLPKTPSANHQRNKPCSMPCCLRSNPRAANLQQFPVNARSSPARVGEAHLPNQIPNFRRHRRATFATPTLPSPIEAKPLAMPVDDGLRFDNEQCRSPVVPQP